MSTSTHGSGSSHGTFGSDRMGIEGTLISHECRLAHRATLPPPLLVSASSSQHLRLRTQRLPSMGKEKAGAEGGGQGGRGPGPAQRALAKGCVGGGAASAWRWVCTEPRFPILRFYPFKFGTSRALPGRLNGPVRPENPVGSPTSSVFCLVGSVWAASSHAWQILTAIRTCERFHFSYGRFPGA